jgi:hypothetical protein
MSEHLRYGFVTDGMNNRLFLSVPGETAVAIQRQNATLTRELKDLSSKRSRIIDIEPDEDNLRIFVNTKKIGRKVAEHDRRAVAGRVLAAMGRVGGHSHELGYESDPNLELNIGRDYTSDDRLHMDARIRWPQKKSGKELVKLTTYFMQDTARKLRYQPLMIKQLVGSDIDKQHGITLTVNPYSGASLETSENSYNYTDDFTEVIQHNIYNPVEQLILFAGAVALAHADELDIPSTRLK